MGAGAIPVDIHKAFRERIKKKHALAIYTADYGYAGEDCFDVSFQGGHFMLTPSKKLLLDFRVGGLMVEMSASQQVISITHLHVITRFILVLILPDQISNQFYRKDAHSHLAAGAMDLI